MKVDLDYIIEVVKDFLEHEKGTLITNETIQDIEEHLRK